MILILAISCYDIDSDISNLDLNTEMEENKCVYVLGRITDMNRATRNRNRH